MSSWYESDGYGLIHLDGTLTARSRAAGKVASIIARNGADLLAADPAPAQVAILYNRLSYMVGGAQPSLSKLGNAPRDSLEGLHRAFSEEQIPVDFVHPLDLLHDKLGSYKILFLPFPVMLSRDVAQAVARYIENGGTVVAEARLAWNDERGFSGDVVPGAGLAEVFGAREKVIRPVEKASLRLENSAGLGLKPGAVATGEAFEEVLEPQAGGRVLARFAGGGPAIVEKTYGKGRAILVGSFLALAYHRHQDRGTKDLLLAFARSAGVRPDVRVAGQGIGDLEVRRLVNDRFEILFAFNHARAPATATLSLRVPWPVEAVRDLVRDQAVPFRQAEGEVVLDRRMVGGEVWVLRLQRR